MRENHKNNLFGVEQNSFYQLSGDRKLSWIEDSYFNVMNNETQEATGENNFLGVSLSQRKIYYALFFVLMSLVLLLGRVFYLQIIQGEHYSLIAKGNRIREKRIQPARGIIYDMNGIQLVKNIPSFALYLIPADLPKKQEQRMALYQELYSILSDFKPRLKERDFIDKIERKGEDFFYLSYQPILIEDHLTRREALLLKIACQNIPGFFIKSETKRSYRTREEDAEVLSLSHLLGYMGRISSQELDQNKDILKNYHLNDQIGKEGLEKQYEFLLRGFPGKEIVEVDAIGKLKQVLAREAPVKGTNLRLYLDFEFQSVIEKILSLHLKQNGLTKGSVIVLDPNSGGVVAMVSLPSYDVNLFARGISQEDYGFLIRNPHAPLFNRSVSGEYPPGSTFKLIVGAAALEEGIVNFNTLFKSVGGIEIGQWFFPDWKAGGHGFVNITRALSESVNTYFYLAGGGNMDDLEGLGVRGIRDYGIKFGLGRVLGMDIPAESTGFLPSPEWKEEVKKERWYIGDTYHLAIGQGDILVTPLQVAAYTAFFANKGVLYQPHLIQAELREGEQSREYVPVVLNQNMVGSDHTETIRYGMRKAVTSGTARYLNSLPLKVAGKTGTAQWSRDKAPHAWFTSFAPFDSPELVVTVLMEEAGEGSEYAVPFT